MMQSADINAEGVVHALQLAGDDLRLTTATPDQLNAAAGVPSENIGSVS
jgi:hypothetical protein